MDDPWTVHGVMVVSKYLFPTDFPLYNKFLDDDGCVITIHYLDFSVISLHVPSTKRDETMKLSK